MIVAVEHDLIPSVWTDQMRVSVILLSVRCVTTDIHADR